MQKTDKMIFIGDSITEWGRAGDSEDIGTGYVRLIHDYLLTTYPDKKPFVLNRGLGGNRITDLGKRWKNDVIDEEPAYVSISIGINDVWRQLDHLEDDQVYPQQFESIYIHLIEQVKEKTNATIILMEPTVIEEKIESEGNQKLIPYAEIVKRLADQYDAVFVPTHQAFIGFLQANTGYSLTIDGVHTNSAGNMLMAKTWIKAFEEKVKIK